MFTPAQNPLGLAKMTFTLLVLVPQVSSLTWRGRPATWTAVPHLPHPSEITARLPRRSSAGLPTAALQVL